MPRPQIYVRVKYPEYACNLKGYLIAQEDSGRWIVKLEYNPFNDTKEPFLLSLEESDFELIEPEGD